MDISVVTPIYNEEGNVLALHKELTDVLHKITNHYEIVAVDDGSKDRSLILLKDIARRDPHFKVIAFKANKGQTAALSAGIEHATGKIIITIDSDLENDPSDIPKMLALMDNGYDVVSGWRKNRWGGSFLKRKLPSVTANWLISTITKVHLHDYGCILKAYKRDVIADVRLYGEMHRFIPAYAYWYGARVTEIEVNYRPRRFGKSNYGFSRTFRVLLDVILVKFLDRYMNRPMHFFGGAGGVSLVAGIACGLVAVVLRITDIRHFVQTPLPVFSALLIIVGIQLIGMGIISEILMRTYYESQGKKPYAIREKINF